jgi:hypothetical protein
VTDFGRRGIGSRLFIGVDPINLLDRIPANQ